jgi:hypothetical protein
MMVVLAGANGDGHITMVVMDSYVLLMNNLH